MSWLAISDGETNQHRAMGNGADSDSTVLELFSSEVTRLVKEERKANFEGLPERR